MMLREDFLRVRIEKKMQREDFSKVKNCFTKNEFLKYLF